MVDGFAVSRAAASDREEILGLWDEVILRGRFGADWAGIDSHIFGTGSPDSAEHVLVARDTSNPGRICATVAAIPMTMLIEGLPVGAIAITGVATRPEYQRRGLMARLLEEAFDSLDATERPLTVLWGYRDRYRRFGFEICGARTTQFVPRRKFSGPSPVDVAAVRELRVPEDAAIIDEYGVPANLVLDGHPGHLDRVYGRALQHTCVYEGPRGRALATVPAAAADAAETLEVLHVVGDAEAAAALLEVLMADGDYGECAVRQPPLASGPLGEYVHMLGEWFRIEHICNLRINDLAALMSALGPRIDERLARAGLRLSVRMSRGDREQMWESGGEGLAVALDLEDHRLVRVLFGPERPSDLPLVPPVGQVLDAVLPLRFDVTPLEGL